MTKKKDKISLGVEIESALENQPMSEIDFCIRMQRFTLFLYKESAVFFIFLAIFMSSFLYFLITVGPTRETILLGIVEAILYLGFYYRLIKKISPFKNRTNEYQEIQDKLDVLLDYRNFRAHQ